MHIFTYRLNSVGVNFWTLNFQDIQVTAEHVLEAL